MSNDNLCYRPDIDGLRAIAILPVVIYHAAPSYLRGGFVGVNVFFVISGFLITSIIYKQIQDGNFKTSTFYARRARRLLPTIFLMLPVVLLLGYFFLLPTELVALGKSALAGLFFSENIHLISEISYFDTEASMKPLLHLWSLGIEEQFYIVWPLILITVVNNKKNT